MNVSLDEEDFVQVMHFCDKSERREYDKVQDRQKKKLHVESLIEKSRGKAEKKNMDSIKDKWLINLTDRVLTSAQEEALRLGLNFAPAPI